MPIIFIAIVISLDSVVSLPESNDKRGSPLHLDQTFCKNLGDHEVQRPRQKRQSIAIDRSPNGYRNFQSAMMVF